MVKEELYQLAFDLVLHSGNARSLAMEALQEARQRNFKEARQKLTEADQELLKAHQTQTKLLHKEAGGEGFDIPLMMIHAQDHLMTAMTMKDMAVEMVDIREEFLG